MIDQGPSPTACCRKDHLVGLPLSYACEPCTKHGFTYKSSVCAYGAEWPTRRSSPVESEKETHASKKHAHPSIKAQALSAMCLSLVDFINLLQKRSVMMLRSPVKVALGQPFGAPEIVFETCTATTLDPILHALVASLRLWHLACKSPKGRELILSLHTHTPAGRLGLLRRDILAMGGPLIILPWCLLSKESLSLMIGGLLGRSASKC